MPEGVAVTPEGGCFARDTGSVVRDTVAVMPEGGCFACHTATVLPEACCFARDTVGVMPEAVSVWPCHKRTRAPEEQPREPGIVRGPFASGRRSVREVRYSLASPRAKIDAT
jgi:hypothetical protein